ADARAARVLQALDAAAPEGVRLPEGTTVGVRAAAAAPVGGQAEQVLTTGPTAARFGGRGAADVVTVARALVEGGWQIERVYRGPTGRERREHPMLQALGDSADGIWRLVVAKQGVQG